MTRWPRRGIGSFHAVVALLLVMGLPARARADGNADALKAEGDAHFDKGRFAEAYDAYRRAYAKRRDPALLYNQGRALEAMGEYPDALDRLENFQWQAPEAVRLRVPKLDELIGDLRSRTATIHVTANEKSRRLYIRDKDVGPVKGERTVRARAGEAKLRLVADGYEPYARTLTLVGGRQLELDVHLDRAAGAEPITSKWWFWTAVGVVVLAGAGTAILAATSEKDPQQGTFGPGPIRVASF